ncbi:type 2 periplasmic-binding domain-containing protein [Jiangella rhizosphaerae]|uniref:Extracellular solute-binding protein n=1 Tax=Jiangella rhizosphaerae TaxID=2293569 RepID=A0A418KXM2_9ACTN|nr:extracellular solute-binding protein [Jiangella rhizosphaerae]RIQ37814.1 extracellular solute-binding protein [Jiangella rhizosphaerae]
MSTARSISRRSLLLGGAGLTLGIGVLAACSTGTPGSTRPTSGGAGSTDFDLPVHRPFNGPAPDLPGTPDGVNPGFLRYPEVRNLVRTVPEPPGDGRPVTAMTPNWAPARPAMNENSFWQYLNSQLGSDLDVQLVPGADYANVFSTTVASGELPDLFTLYRAPRLPELLEAEAVDLTDHLAGDAIAAYPNLANIPTEAWRFSVYNGRIRTIPLWRGLRTSNVLFQRTDLLEAAGLPTEFSDFDEFLDVAREISDPAHNRWAFANFPMEFLRQCLGIDNRWTHDGEDFVSYWADERQADFFEAGRKLMDAGVVHPDAFTGAGHKERFMSGESVFAADGMSAWAAYYQNVASSFPDVAGTFKIDGTRVFDFADGYDGAPWRGADVLEQCGIGNGAQDRIETVLAVANYLAAPIGSVEKLASWYGKEGDHFTIENGEPARTETGNVEWLNLGLLMNAPFEVEAPGFPDAVSVQHAFQTYLNSDAKRNPADGLYVESLVANGGSLDITMTDLTNEILQGRQDAGAWRTAVDDYQLNGGEEIALELAEVYAATRS